MLKFNEHSAEADAFHFEACCQELGGESFFTNCDVDMRPIKFIPILFTNRSGSNFVSQLIGSSRKYNTAAEIFNSDEITRVCRENGMNYFHEYISAIAASNAVNDYFFVKLGMPHLFLLEKAGLLPLFFNRQKALWSRRVNTIEQAVSFYIAERTGIWASYQAAKENGPSIEDYDFSQIYHYYNLIKNQESRINSFTSSNAVACFEVTYEKLCLDAVGTINGIADFLEIDNLTVNMPSVSVSKQANEVNFCFEQRFIDELKELQG